LAESGEADRGSLVLARKEPHEARDCGIDKCRTARLGKGHFESRIGQVPALPARNRAEIGFGQPGRNLDRVVALIGTEQADCCVSFAHPFFPQRSQLGEGHWIRIDRHGAKGGIGSVFRQRRRSVAPEGEFSHHLRIADELYGYEIACFPPLQHAAKALQLLVESRVAIGLLPCAGLLLR
jgi:hypothetical protein